jgi:molybdate transport system substrate-binding protein
MRRRAALAAPAALAPWPLRAAPAAAPVAVFAAASLADVLPAILRAAGHAGVRYAFAASSVLARQIEQGAPAHVFVSADEPWMDHLQQRGLLQAGTRRDFAGNRLVVVRTGAAPAAGAEESADALRAALAGGRIATGDPAHVPVGRYAEAALKALGLWHEAAPRLVRAENVRSALAFVERGEAACGIVYATDAALSQRAQVAARFPRASHPPIRYPAAIVSGSGPAALPVFRALFTPAAQALLRAAGFEGAGG